MKTTSSPLRKQLLTLTLALIAGLAVQDVAFAQKGKGGGGGGRRGGGASGMKQSSGGGFRGSSSMGSGNRGIQSGNRGIQSGNRGIQSGNRGIQSGNSGFNSGNRGIQSGGFQQAGREQKQGQGQIGGQFGRGNASGRLQGQGGGHKGSSPLTRIPGVLGGSRGQSLGSGKGAGGSQGLGGGRGQGLSGGKGPGIGQGLGGGRGQGLTGGKGPGSGLGQGLGGSRGQGGGRGQGSGLGQGGGKGGSGKGANWQKLQQRWCHQPRVQLLNHCHHVRRHQHLHWQFNDWCHYYPTRCHWWYSWCGPTYYFDPTCCVVHNWYYYPCTVVRGNVTVQYSWHLGLNCVFIPGRGLGVQEVEAGSPADLAGFQPGMVLLAANGVALDNDGAMQSVIEGSNGLLNLTVLPSAEADPVQVDVQMQRLTVRGF